MDQRTHAWIASRAIALLEDEGKVPGLVNLLKTSAKDAAVGAWLPDKTVAKAGHGETDNHIFKMKPLPEGDAQAARFVADRLELAKRLRPDRRLSSYLKNDAPLPDSWWKVPYKADAPPGHHIPNCVMGMRLTITDLLVTGNTRVRALTMRPQKPFAELRADVCTSTGQAALYFMMISHFVADASMPCHCDARKLAGYSNGLHKELEAHWSEKVGGDFDDEKLRKTNQLEDQILKRAREVDAEFGVQFAGPVPKVKAGRDAWLEMVDVCRGSFALASVIASPNKIGYDSTEEFKYDQAFAGAEGQALLKRVDEITMHDAVLNVATVWKDIWLDFITR